MHGAQEGRAQISGQLDRAAASYTTGADTARAREAIQRVGVDEVRQTAFPRLTNEIALELEAILSGVVRIEHVRSRLLNPVPERAPSPKAPGAENPGTLEQHLAQLGVMAHALAERVHQLAETLERGI